MLKRRRITHGCYVHALGPADQLREMFDRLDLAASARPFTLCLKCNAPLHAVGKAQVASALPPGVRDRHERFSRCDRCLRVFWEGSHWQRMRSMIDDLLAVTI